MTEKDFYKILGIGRTATENEIKKAYRQLAMQYHPDRNPENKEAEERFKEISEAYQVLSDPQKRNNYDRFGRSGVKSAGFNNMGGFVDPFDIFRDVFGGGFGDIFGMGGVNRQNTFRKGSDVQIHLKLNLEEIAHGVRKKIKIKNYVVCTDCDGTGSTSGTSSTKCPSCQGRGETVFRQGFFAVSQTCQRCHGEGKIIESPCAPCHGEGRIKGESTVELDIPAGVASGHYLTVRNAGNVGPRGGPRGDVIVVIDEIQHEYFERHGDDILYNLFLGFTQVALGDEVEIPTLAGKVKISISPGTQSGKILRLRGKGIPNIETQRSGDQLLRILVYTPLKLNSKEKSLLEQLAQQPEMFPVKGDKTIFERIKEAIQ
jgi:molecular chaperone DnaJ